MPPVVRAQADGLTIKHPMYFLFPRNTRTKVLSPLGQTGIICEYQYVNTLHL